MKYVPFLLMAGLACCAHLSFSQPKDKPELVSFVDPFIGTDAHGHTFPGATLPFGMVQLSPDTRLEGWDGCSGYHYSDKRIYGFSHTHLSGTGVADYCDVLIKPYTGRPLLQPEEYASEFEKASEIAEPGYYSVELEKGKIRAELTATTRTGIHRYTFSEDEQFAHFLIDLRHRDPVIESSMTAVNNQMIVGYRKSSSWAKEQRVFFAIRFSRPFLAAKIRDMEVSPRAAMQSGTGKAILGTVDFANKNGEPIVVSVGISGVSVEGALQNLQREAPDFDFDKYRKEARAAWEQSLSAIEVAGGSTEQKRVFYTALYHTMIAPNMFSDINGQYRGHDGNTHLSRNQDVYTVFSLWDTYRACKPLYTLIESDRMNDFIQSFLLQYQQSGLLPVWELAGNETNCMIGYHSVPVIADAWRKGIRKYEGSTAFEAMQASAQQDEWGLEWYKDLGYIPADKEGESVSKSLEYTYDDWTIAQMAKMLGDEEAYVYYVKRAQNWKHLYDPSSGFFRAKKNASWHEPFDPFEVNFFYTEANAWQYRFAVPHDISTLMNWMGGPKVFTAELDKLFTASAETTGRNQADITGLIGQYAHGNEPSHHMAYLYNYAGQPWKTQERVRQIMDELYTDKPNGLCGNEDVGQMSAWLVFSAMGFYPVVPASNIYAVGTPWFEEVRLHLGNGKLFEIKAPGVSTQKKYINGLSYNGSPWKKSYIVHDMIDRGGSIQFDMSSSPTQWATDPNDWPVQAVKDHPIIAVPFVEKGERVFRDSQEIHLGNAMQDTDILYTLDGSEPNSDSSKVYTEPFVISEETTLRMLARQGSRVSPEASAQFSLLKNDLKIFQYKTRYTNPYTGGGDEGLIDQIRGGADFRSGGWQGFYGVNMDVVVDLGSINAINKVSVGFLQDENSWIFYPKSLQVEVSEDGDSFTPIGSAANTIAVTATGGLQQELSVQANGTSARYIRVIGTSLGNCPPEHKGAGNPCWVFADEITIE